MGERVALVTGASRGIGRAVARRLARRGMTVVLGFHSDRAAAEGALPEVQAHAPASVVQQLDAGDVASVRAAFGAVGERFGRLDVLVNNAATAAPSELETLSLEQWERTLRVNLTGPFLCTQAALRLMKPQGRGRIVNVSSVAGTKMGGILGADYSASKAGLVGFTLYAARALAGSGIAVNAVAPSFTETDMLRGLGFGDEALARMRSGHPMGRLAEPDEVAAAVALLCEDDATYVSGACLYVTGGG